MGLRRVVSVTVVWAIPTIFGAAAELGFASDSSYDECVVNHMKGIGSDVAAKAVLFSCRQLFPDPNAIKPVPIEDWPPDLADLARRIRGEATPPKSVQEIVAQDPDLSRWVNDADAWKVAQEVDSEIARRPGYQNSTFSDRRAAVVTETKRRLGE